MIYSVVLISVQMNILSSARLFPPQSQICSGFSGFFQESPNFSWRQDIAVPCDPPHLPFCGSHRVRVAWVGPTPYRCRSRCLCYSASSWNVLLSSLPVRIHLSFQALFLHDVFAAISVWKKKNLNLKFFVILSVKYYRYCTFQKYILVSIVVQF